MTTLHFGDLLEGAGTCHVDQFTSTPPGAPPSPDLNPLHAAPAHTIAAVLLVKLAHGVAHVIREQVLREVCANVCCKTPKAGVKRCLSSRWKGCKRRVTWGATWGVNMG